MAMLNATCLLLSQRIDDRLVCSVKCGDLVFGFGHIPTAQRFNYIAYRGKKRVHG